MHLFKKALYYTYSIRHAIIFTIQALHTSKKKLKGVQIKTALLGGELF